MHGAGLAKSYAKATFRGFSICASLLTLLVVCLSGVSVFFLVSISFGFLIILLVTFLCYCRDKIKKQLGKRI